MKGGQHPLEAHPLWPEFRRWTEVCGLTVVQRWQAELGGVGGRAVSEEQAKDHPLWPKFVAWYEDRYQVRFPQWEKLVHWRPYWECFLAGVEAEFDRITHE